jgi:hypothetical protein
MTTLAVAALVWFAVAAVAALFLAPIFETNTTLELEQWEAGYDVCCLRVADYRDPFHTQLEL